MNAPIFRTVTLSLLGLIPMAQESIGPLDVARNPAEVEITGAQPHRAAQLIVRLEDCTDLAIAGSMLDGERYLVEESLMPSIGMFLVRILDGTRVVDAIPELNARDSVLYAAPDHLVQERATVPNDPSFGSQWYHDKMQSALAWDLGQGSLDYVVSVVDGGCLITHEDIAPNLHVNQAEAGGSPGVDDDGNGFVDDVNGWDAYANDGTIPNSGHGTHVNGISGARGNNGLGVAGVNWRVSLMPVAGSSGSTSTVTKAYNYALVQKQLWLATGGAKGANVVSTNSSFGVDYGNCNGPTYAPWNDSYNALGAVGILSCAATMNINANVDVTGDVPTGCSSPWLVAVTNTTSSDVKNSGAAYGATMIDLGAPGTNIYSTYSTGGYTNMTGTSMASPQAAGAIAFLHSVASAPFAVLRAADPAQAALELKQVMLDHVDLLPSLQGITVSGGRLNLFESGKAINAWSGSGGTAGTIALYGTGLGGANIGILDSRSIPNIGTVVTFDAANFNGSGTLLLIIAGGRASSPFLGGTLLVDLGTALLQLPISITGGTGSADVALPSSPALVGKQVYAQCGGPDALLPQGVALSNGVIVTVGS